ncbi:hypothetical protein PG985_011516 [Apiospora marii]|uniref:Uncharacterized protein n=1 Tax=Apiospora marii TaxID=335849 RepID=A0ABR1R0X7_9PEZI
MPLLVLCLWRSDLQAIETVVRKDEVPSVFYPSFAVTQNAEWSSQANLTLDSKPKCFVGWMKDSLPACDRVEKPGDWCNCTSQSDTAISSFVWQNTTYNLLAWNADTHMVNSRPTTPILAQAFFTFDSAKSYHDSFAHTSPSLWLAIWDTALSLQESLEYGYTRLQLIDAAATSSVNLGLFRKELPGRKPAYDYRISAITTVRETGLTCDPSDENYGPCRVTVLIQYSDFHRDIMTQKQGMELWVSWILS